MKIFTSKQTIFNQVMGFDSAQLVVVEPPLTLLVDMRDFVEAHKNDVLSPQPAFEIVQVDIHKKQHITVGAGLNSLQSVHRFRGSALLSSSLTQNLPRRSGRVAPCCPFAELYFYTQNISI